MTGMEFAEFYQGNRDRCLSAIAVVVKDRMLAEDLNAEAFARAFARWSKVSEHPDPRAWVVRTALNANISRWRRHRREMYVPELLDNTPSNDMPMADDGLAAALAALPLRQRQVIALRIFLDLDAAASSRVLGISPGAVSTHLQRAISALKTALISTYQPGGLS